MFFIIFHLDLTTSVGLIQCFPHGVRDGVRIHDDMAFRITGRTADSLDQGSRTSKESFLICIQNGHQSDLRNIQTLSQQVDTYQYIEHIQTHIPDDLGTLQRINVRMQIFHPNTDFLHIIREILCHPLGQCGDQYLMMLCDLLVDLSDQVIDLSLYRAHLYFRIQQTCGTNDLLCPQQFMLLLIIGRSGGYEHHLVDMRLEFLKVQRSIIQCRGQTETVVHQCLLSRAVPGIHTADLWDRHMGLVHDDQEIIRKKVQQRHGRCSRRKSVQMSGIVLDTGTETGLPEHLNIEIRPFRNPLGLDQLVFALEKLYPFLHLFFDIVTGCLDLLLRYHIMGCREDRHMIQLCMNFPCKRLYLCDPVDLIPEKFDTDEIIAALCRIYFHHISPDAESGTLNIHIVAVVLNIDQFPQYLVTILHHAGTQGYDQILIFVGASQTIDTGHAGHYHHIPAFRQGCCR